MAGFVRNQPRALMGFGTQYVGARPSLAGGKRARSPLQGGSISAELGRSLLENRILQLESQKAAAGDAAPAAIPERLSTAPSAAGAAVSRQVEAALASVTVGLQSGLYSSSALIEPCKAALESLLAGASELSLSEINSLLEDVKTLKSALDTDFDGEEVSSQGRRSGQGLLRAARRPARPRWMCRASRRSAGFCGGAQGRAQGASAAARARIALLSWRPLKQASHSRCRTQGRGRGARARLRRQ